MPRHAHLGLVSHRRRSRRRHGPQRPRGAAQREDRLRLSGVQSSAAHQRIGERRAADAVRPQRQKARHAGAGHGRAAARRTRRAARSPAERVVRRSAAARGNRPRAGDRAGHHPRGRADRKSRHADVDGSDGAVPGAERTRHHHRPRDARAGHRRLCETDRGSPRRTHPPRRAGEVAPLRRVRSRSFRGKGGRMKSKTLVKLATQSILKNKMRAALTMLGIIIGVAAVVVMVAVGYGARTRIRAQINNLGTNMIVITPGAAQQAGVSQGAQAFPNLSLKDVDKIRAEAQTVSAVSPVIVSRTAVIGPSGNWRTQINGVDVDYQTIRDWQPATGDFFSADDVRPSRKVVVLGNTVAQNLFPGQDPVGSEIQIRNSVYKIVGVLAPKGQTASVSDSDDVVLMPYTTASATLSGRTFIPQILASTANEQDIPAAQEEIRTLLRESHKVSDGNDDFTVKNQADLASAAESSTQVMTLLLAAIASISLLVGGIGIMNIMLVSVTERTREIGIRMAIGARGSDVLTQFLVESIVMGVLGGLAGLILGVAGAKLVGHFTGWETMISPLIMLVSVGFSGGGGVFFGYYPARKAAALNPIQALRYE